LAILVTRPQPECKRTAERLRQSGLDAVEAPMLEMAEIAPDTFELGGVTGLAVTSSRVAPILQKHKQFAQLAVLPVFTVGERSADAMRSAGFSQVFSADGDVNALAGLIRDKIPDGYLFYPCARDRAGHLEDQLAPHGIRCDPVVVYSMDPAPGLSPQVLDRLRSGSIDRALVYSKRTARAFVDALARDAGLEVLKGLSVLAISSQAAKPLAGYTLVKIAVHPTEEALLELALSPC
jgi:uroporphyrinogen-III synthase